VDGLASPGSSAREELVKKKKAPHLIRRGAFLLVELVVVTGDAW
jgi:hypothetical protein